MNNNIDFVRAETQHRRTQIRRAFGRKRRNRDQDIHPDNRPGMSWVEARSFELLG